MRLFLLGFLVAAACGDNNVPEEEMTTPKLVVVAGNALHTTEAGGTTTFTVGLDSAPSVPTTVTLASSKPSEGTVSPATVQLTPESFSGALVTVTGVDDSVLDGDQSYQIHVNGGTMGEKDVDITNEDDEVGGITVSAPSSTTTTEIGGVAMFTVVLTGKPTANVTIPVTTTDATEGAVSASQLVFTPANWDTPQTITATGQNDDVDDGDIAYSIALGAATSTDAAFSGMNPPDVALTNTDDDTRNYTIGAISGTTSETGTDATFTVVLASEPTADVTIQVSSGDATEGSVLPASLTFTPANWDTAQTVTVHGLDDVLDDGDITYNIVLGSVTSTDAGYAGLDPADVSVTNVDDDGPVATAGVTVTAPAGGLVTDENGQTDSFMIVLQSQPTDAVTIPIASNLPGEASPQVTNVTFTTLDWNIPQQVIVDGVDDLIVDGPKAYTILLGPTTSVDAAYNGLTLAGIPGTNADNDNAFISVAPTDGLFVSEFLDTDTFDIVLLAQPTGDVVVPLTTSDATEGTIFPTNVTSVTFTSANWNVPQTITVRGVDDLDPDGNVVFSIITGAATSTDAAFNGVNPADVTVTNIDNETANVFVQARKTLRTSETGGPSGSAKFRVRLTTVPTAPVTCTLASNDLTEGQVSPQTLVFTTTDFQTVTVTGIDDAIVDGDISYTIITAACTSADPSYNARNPRDVRVINRDND